MVRVHLASRLVSLHTARRVRGGRRVAPGLHEVCAVSEAAGGGAEEERLAGDRRRGGAGRRLRSGWRWRKRWLGEVDWWGTCRGVTSHDAHRRSRREAKMPRWALTKKRRSDTQKDRDVGVKDRGIGV